MLQQKKAALNQNARRDIAKLISEGKLESARIKVEHIIREDYLIEALEMLQLYCDTLLARFGLVLTQKDLDSGIAEAVSVVVYSAPRVNVQELNIIREQLLLKYGKELQNIEIDPKSNNVNPRIVHKLGITTPDAMLVKSYMSEIAAHFKVDYDEDEERNAGVDMQFTEPNIKRVETDQFQDPSMRQDQVPIDMPQNQQEPDFDFLAKRFDSLKRK